MFSFIRERYCSTIDFDQIIKKFKIFGRYCISLKLKFLNGKLNIMLTTEAKSQLEEKVKRIDVIALKKGVISLADGRDGQIFHPYAKL